MAITQRNVGAGVGGATLGVGGAEVVRQAVEREMLSPRAGWLLVGGGAASTAGLAAAHWLGAIELPPGIPAILTGVAGGSTGWYAARSVDVAPRLVVDIPNEVNLASPLVTAFTLGMVGVVATTAARLVS